MNDAKIEQLLAAIRRAGHLPPEEQKKLREKEHADNNRRVLASYGLRGRTSGAKLKVAEVPKEAEAKVLPFRPRGDRE